MFTPLLKFYIGFCLFSEITADGYEKQFQVGKKINKLNEKKNKRLRKVCTQKLFIEE